MRLVLEKVVVSAYKSGSVREGQLRPFTIPDDATIVKVSHVNANAIVYFVRPTGKTR